MNKSEHNGKCRTFWLDDDEWNAIKEYCKEECSKGFPITISDLIKGTLREKVPAMEAVYTQKTLKRIDQHKYDDFDFKDFGTTKKKKVKTDTIEG